MFLAVLQWWTFVLFSHLQQLQKEPQSENEEWMEMAGKQRRRWSSSSWITEVRPRFICPIRRLTRWPCSKCVRWHKVTCSVFYLSVCLLVYNTNNSLGRIGVALFVFLCEKLKFISWLRTVSLSLGPPTWSRVQRVETKIAVQNLQQTVTTVNLRISAPTPPRISAPPIGRNLK